MAASHVEAMERHSEQEFACARTSERPREQQIARKYRVAKTQMGDVGPIRICRTRSIQRKAIAMPKVSPYERFAFLGRTLLILALSMVVMAQDDPPYTTYKSFDEVLKAGNVRYPEAIRVTSAGTTERPTYHGFFFYNCLQFDPTGRSMLAFRVYIQERAVQPSDMGHVGIIDLQKGNNWTTVGQSTAWNWQQGCRVQWRPRSEEILWNDRSDDGKKFVCRAYDFRTGKTRTLPRPTYALSPDGTTALTHDFERMKHRGTDYVGIPDKYEDQYAPKETGIWKMDLNTGETEMIMSLDRIADIVHPDKRPSKGLLYFFREGWNPSGTRFIAFVKNHERNRTKFTLAYSMTAEGTDVRFLYNNPSHHFWVDDSHVADWSRTLAPKGYYLFKDDGSGKPKALLWKSDYNGHDIYHPNSEWVLSDTYSISGWQYLFLFHLRTKLFVPLGKFEARNARGLFRVDLHPRFSPDGNLVSFDATHEGLGRQIYTMDISRIVSNPPDATRGRH